MSEQTINPEITRIGEAKAFGEANFDDLYARANEIVDKDKLNVVDVREEVKAAQEVAPGFKTEKEFTEHGLRYVIQVGRILATNRDRHAPEIG